MATLPRSSIKRLYNQIQARLRKHFKIHNDNTWENKLASLTTEDNSLRTTSSFKKNAPKSLLLLIVSYSPLLHLQGSQAQDRSKWQLRCQRFDYSNSQYNLFIFSSLRPVLTCAMMLQEEMECAIAEGASSSQDHPRNQPVVHYEFIPNLTQPEINCEGLRRTTALLNKATADIQMTIQFGKTLETIPILTWITP
ncbi:hypothetical protein CEXT_376191 [Caerostris extrusa]|uniref:Uncharacterized protein n=1 Tax=Caerostris extrusa TaxID=172846 RepID=A0AAV4PMB4_CAEEX|nr:hypothetical protein CEXT_376191 [Caerostris extrusa]